MQSWFGFMILFIQYVFKYHIIIVAFSVLVYVMNKKTLFVICGFYLPVYSDADVLFK